MSTIVPQSELTRKAVAHVSEQLQVHPAKALTVLVEEAAVHFNLGPLESTFLLELFQKEGEEKK